MYEPTTYRVLKQGIKTNYRYIDLDYVCPFSAKLFNTFYNSAKPIITQQYPSKIQVIFRQHIQPWHPSSTLVHEAAAAVLKIAPEKFWQFSADLFKHQEEFFDVNVVNETRNKTYGRLAKIARGVGVDEHKILDLLTVPERAGENGQLNIGNHVTNDIKLMVKAHRVVGVHVSPTVYFNVWYPNQTVLPKQCTDINTRALRSRESAAVSMLPNGNSGWPKM